MSEKFLQIIGTVTLKKGRDWSARSGHPWVFSGAIQKTSRSFSEGDVVQVLSSDGERLGTGFFGEQGIAVRLLTFGAEELTAHVISRRFDEAYQLRRSLGLIDSAGTNAYRLINAEGDFLPGLTIDIYNDTVVLQCHTLGFLRQRPLICENLQRLYASRLIRIFDKSAHVLEKDEMGAPLRSSYLLGTAGQIEIQENANRFIVDCEDGQKTGFFLDQRDNRRLIGEVCRGKRVLNAFCYTGGFSVYALAGGAAHVDSVDVSKKAVEWASRNIELNFSVPAHTSIVADCFDFLKDKRHAYEVIVLDPPAFAKQRSAVENAIKGYQRLNREGLRCISPGGFVATFSCSQHVDRELFEAAVRRAAYEAGRQVQIVRTLGAAPCHPLQMQHPEGRYLKGLLLYVVS